MQATPETIRKQPPPMVCTHCGERCDPMNATARTGRDTICICCHRWFCEFCLYEHQRSPEYRNPHARRFMQVTDRN